MCRPTSQSVWYRVCVLSKEGLIETLGIAVSKQSCNLLFQDRLQCLWQVSTLGHCMNMERKKMVRRIYGREQII